MAAYIRTIRPSYFKTIQESLEAKSKFSQSIRQGRKSQAQHLADKTLLTNLQSKRAINKYYCHK